MINLESTREARNSVADS